MIDNTVDWNTDILTESREKNNQQQWLPGCWQCERLEKTGAKSFRKSMIEKFGVRQNLSGPQRIDLLFDRSCNLACSTCGPHSSSMWIKHLKDNNLETQVVLETSNLEKIKSILKTLDLSNIGMIQFCGGETLLGNTYWQAAELLAELVPDAKNKLELGFQTNGTQSIDPKYYDLIDKFKLVKLMVSIDGVGEKFEYLRWPASWNQTVDNIFQLRNTVPSNVMFSFNSTVGCYNAFEILDVWQWFEENLSTNREGDVSEFCLQLAYNYDIANLTLIAKQDIIAQSSKIPQLAMITNYTRSVINRPSSLGWQQKLNQIDQGRGTDWKSTLKIGKYY
jgi:sulfatase maturation enzyme AslB (radical SAM superfamily)